MSKDVDQLAAEVRQACIAAALEAYEDAGFSGLCHEGRWELAIDAMRSLDLGPLLDGLSSGSPGGSADDR